MNNAIKCCLGFCVVILLVSAFWLKGLADNNVLGYFFVPFHELVNILVLSIVVYYFV